MSRAGRLRWNSSCWVQARPFTVTWTGGPWGAFGPRCADSDGPAAAAAAAHPSSANVKSFMGTSIQNLVNW